MKPEFPRELPINQNERRVPPIIKAAIFGLGAVAIHEVQQYRENRLEYAGILDYAKYRAQTILENFKDDSGTYSYKTVITGAKNYFHRFNSEADQPSDDFSPPIWVKPKFSDDSTSSGVDSLASELHPNQNEDCAFIDPGAQSIAVFDGVGGNAGSALASNLASKITRTELSNISTTQFTIEDSLKELEGVLEKIDTEIVATGTGTATTATIGKLFKGSRGEAYAGIAFVADSRAYLIRDGKLHFVTYDDGYHNGNVPKEVRSMQSRLASVTEVSQLTNEERIAFRFRNQINGALGQNPKIVSCYVPLKPGDRLLFTTDGIHDNLTMEEIEQSAIEANSDKSLAVALTTKSQQRSRTDHMRAKTDDITAAAITYHASDRSQEVLVHNSHKPEASETPPLNLAAPW